MVPRGLVIAGIFTIPRSESEGREKLQNPEREFCLEKEQ